MISDRERKYKKLIRLLGPPLRLFYTCAGETGSHNTARNFPEFFHPTRDYLPLLDKLVKLCITKYFLEACLPILFRINAKQEYGNEYREQMIVFKYPGQPCFLFSSRKESRPDAGWVSQWVSNVPPSGQGSMLNTSSLESIEHLFVLI